MNFELYDFDKLHEVKEFFRSVFTDSEGKEEGELIGNLTLELQEMTDSKDRYGFIAKEGERIVGCIFFTRMSFDKPINAFILSPVAISTSSQKQGLGQGLIKFGINYLKENNVEIVVTYGDPNYYSKVGFKQIDEKVLKAPFKLTYPEGWLAQSLSGGDINPIKGESTCVKALSSQGYW